MNRLWRRVLFLIWRGRRERDLADEMKHHLEMKARKLMDEGVAPEEARYRARREFGNTLLLRETSRDVWGWGAVDRLRQDLRYGVRVLANNPTFTLVAVLTLAVGIGVNTAIFTAFNAVALRPLDVPEPDRVVQIDRSTQAGFFSYPDYEYFRDNNRVFSGLTAASFFAFSMTGAPAWRSSGQGGIASAAGFSFPEVIAGNNAEPVVGMLVSGNYFQVLGVAPVLGRGFIAEEDDKPGAQPVLLLSDNFWERRFGRDPNLVGKTLVMNDVAFTVIGITPRDFIGTVPMVPAVWAPLAMRTRLDPVTDVLHSRTMVCCRLHGRLRPESTGQQAQAEVRGLFTRLRQMFPQENSGEGAKTDRAAVVQATAFGAPDKELFKLAALVLAAVSMVLLIACSNVAGLLLARSANRQKEIAIRLAIGASRGRLVRQLLTESALISVLAGVTGLVFAWWTLHFLMVQISESMPVRWITIALRLAPDHRVFAYMLLLSMAAAIAFGLAPAVQASKPNLTVALKEEGAWFGRLRKSGLRDILVALQVAVSLMLLIGAGLLARGSQRAFGVDLGFDYRNMIVVEFPREPRLDPAKMTAARHQLLKRIEALPGVKLASVASRTPLMEGADSVSVSLDGRPLDSKQAPEADYSLVTPDYFETVGIPILRGRNFSQREVGNGTDVNGAPVILSAATARKFWPGQDPIGKRIAFATPADALNFPGALHLRSASSLVIGVVKDIRTERVDKFDETCMYLPVPRTFSGSIVVRTSGDPKPVVTALRGELAAMDSAMQALIFDFRAAFSFQPAFVLSRIGAIGSAIIGILGLLLASVGIYGMVSFAVSQRTHEVGVRMAMGARGRDVLGLLLRETMRPVAIGVVIGLAAAAGVSQVLVAFLFGLSTLDPVTFVGVAALLMVVATLAGYVPARRATKVDPMVALRYE